MAVLKIKPTPKGEGGSKVVANPELTGDEQNLEGLEVEGTKYKVSGGSGSGSDLILGYEVIELGNKHLDVDALIALLHDKGATGNEHYISIGLEYNTSTSDLTGIAYIYDDSGCVYATAYNSAGSTGISYGENIYDSLTINKNTIEQIPVVDAEVATTIDDVNKVFQPLITLVDAESTTIIKVTKQEILDLFVD